MKFKPLVLSIILIINELGRTFSFTCKNHILHPNFVIFHRSGPATFPYRGGPDFTKWLHLAFKASRDFGTRYQTKSLNEF